MLEEASRRDPHGAALLTEPRFTTASQKWTRPVFEVSAERVERHSALGASGAEQLSSVDDECAAALTLLRSVEKDPRLWSRIELRAGDVAVADSTVALRPTEPAGTGGGRNVERAQTAGSFVEPYEELEVLRACAQDREHADQALLRTHALWVGLDLGPGLSPLNLSAWKDMFLGFTC